MAEHQGVTFQAPQACPRVLAPASGSSGASSPELLVEINAVARRIVPSHDK